MNEEGGAANQLECLQTSIRTREEGAAGEDDAQRDGHTVAQSEVEEGGVGGAEGERRL